MSVTTVRTVYCDGCSAWVQDTGQACGEAVREARLRLRAQGWQVGIVAGPVTGRKEQPVRDYCPACVANGPK